LKDSDIYDLNKTLNVAKYLKPIKLVVIAPYDKHTLLTVKLAQNKGIVIPILVGKKNKINSNYYDLDIVDTDYLLEVAGEFIKDGNSILMKGMISTKDFVKMVLNKEWGIRCGNLLSHIGLLEIPGTKRIFLLTDSGLNILPDVDKKLKIIQNAVVVAKKLGINHIKIAMLAAIEKPDPLMIATIDPIDLKELTKDWDCDLDGPFAFDIIFDKDKAEIKGISGAVAGKANIIIVPNIEVGNVIWKMFTCFIKDEGAGVIVGGSIPIVVPSRADSIITKLNSIKLARLLYR